LRTWMKRAWLKRRKSPKQKNQQNPQSFLWAILDHAQKS